MNIVGGTVEAVISLVVMVYLVPLLPFVTNEYSQWLPIGINATVISAVIRMSRFKVFALLPAMYSTYYLAQIFPFNFGSVAGISLNPLIQLSLYISIFGMGIAFIVQVIKLFSPQSK